MSIITGGTIAIDNVKTPKAEEKNLLGGSAAYASLAASYFHTPVHLVGIIGKDYPKEHLEMLESHGITLDGVERSDQESFTWTGEYLENMNDRETLSVGLNVLESWSLEIPDTISNSEHVLLANMSPQNQLEMLELCDSEERFVIADTMDLWITIAKDQLHEVFTQVDLLVLNESEAQLLAETSNLVLAGKLLLEKGPKFVIVKMGEFGATLFAQDGSIFRCPSYPLAEVTDPTGAGDSFVGALIGHLASLPKECTDYDFIDLSNGMVRGTVLASFTCEAFSTRKLQSLSKEDIQGRLEELYKMSKWSI
ncbi:PfkB family carbohydrate kinase [Akkermansiaceae bacterium]|nr:PfkB family carbohydrate kinase [Akkermansiaceae bacterium]